MLPVDDDENDDNLFDDPYAEEKPKEVAVVKPKEESKPSTPKTSM